jgi:hypothetical protein
MNVCSLIFTLPFATFLFAVCVSTGKHMSPPSSTRPLTCFDVANLLIPSSTFVQKLVHRNLNLPINTTIHPSQPYQLHRWGTKLLHSSQKVLEEMLVLFSVILSEGLSLHQRQRRQLPRPIWEASFYFRLDVESFFWRTIYCHSLLTYSDTYPCLLLPYL